MTHPNDPTLRSFIDVDATSDFPIQNLPYGVFSAKDGLAPRVGVAIGDYVLDLWQLVQDCRIDVVEPSVFAASTLNPFMALGPRTWSRTRARRTAETGEESPSSSGSRAEIILQTIPVQGRGNGARTKGARAPRWRGG